MVQQGHPGGPAAERGVLRSVLKAALDRLDAGEWEAAHALVQALPSKEGAWIHAHLHRIEGDGGNAAYWYGKAGRPVPTDDVAAERAQIRGAVEAL